MPITYKAIKSAQGQQEDGSVGHIAATVIRVEANLGDVQETLVATFHDPLHGDWQAAVFAHRMNTGVERLMQGILADSISSYILGKG